MEPVVGDLEKLARWRFLHGGRKLYFSVLGAVEVQANGVHLEFRGVFQRTLLFSLLAGEGAPVTTDSLTEELWGPNPPRNFENALQAHISRLRRKLERLEPDRTDRLAGTPSGYRLHLESDELDATVFATTFRDVRTQPALSPADAVDKLRGALRLWRGAVFGGSSGGPICRAAAARWEEMRLAALELLYDYELRIGRHAEIIPELRALVETTALNERFHEQLMVALYRAGRQTDALALYRRIWSRLREELGIEPSPALQWYERAILAHDPVLLRGTPHYALSRS